MIYFRSVVLTISSCWKSLRRLWEFDLEQIFTSRHARAFSTRGVEHTHYRWENIPSIPLACRSASTQMKRHEEVRDQVQTLSWTSWAAPMSPKTLHWTCSTLLLLLNSVCRFRITPLLMLTYIKTTTDKCPVNACHTLLYIDYH